MSHAVILPVLLPLVAAVAMLLLPSAARMLAVLAAVALAEVVEVGGGVDEGLAPSVPELVGVGLLDGVPLALGVCVPEGVEDGGGGSGAHASAWKCVSAGGMASTVVPTGASVASHDRSAEGYVTPLK